jgi:hypothetical protein
MSDDWRDRAACKGHAALFYRLDDPESVEQMIRTCAFCPVRGECIDEGERLVDRHTVRAGLRLWKKEERPW